MDQISQTLGGQLAARAVARDAFSARVDFTIDTRRMHYDNLKLLAPFHFRPRDVIAARDLLCAGQLGAGRLINAQRSLAELDEVFALLERGAALKCAVIP